MLADGGHRVHAGLERAAAPWRQQRRQRAGRRADFAPARARPQLRVRPQAGHVVDASVGDLRRVEPRLDLGRGERGKGGHDQRLQLAAVRVPARVGGKALVAGQRRLLQHAFAERLPFALVLQPQHHGAAIAGRKRPVGVDAGVAGAAARGRRRAVEGVVHRVAHPLAQRFEHRDVDVTALARPGAQQQRRQDAGEGVHAGGDVGDRNAGLGRRVGRAGDRQETRLALDQQVVGLLVAIRPVVAIARDVAHDEPGVRFTQRVERQPHARRGARRQVLQQHVGAGQQVPQHRPRLGVLEVERQAFLAAVGPHEVRGLAPDARVVGAREVARAGALDLDHARPQVGQLAAGERRGDGVFERDDGDAVEGAQWWGHGSSGPVRGLPGGGGGGRRGRRAGSVATSGRALRMGEVMWRRATWAWAGFGF